MGVIAHQFKHTADPDANCMAEFSSDYDPTSAYSAPTGDATWTKFTSNVSASLLLACEDAGYQLWEFSGTAYRVPMFLGT